MNRREVLTGVAAALAASIAPFAATAQELIPGWIVDPAGWRWPASQEELASLMDMRTVCIHLAQQEGESKAFIWSWPDDYEYKRMHSYDINTGKWTILKPA